MPAGRIGWPPAFACGLTIVLEKPVIQAWHGGLADSAGKRLDLAERCFLDMYWWRRVGCEPDASSRGFRVGLREIIRRICGNALFNASLSGGICVDLLVPGWVDSNKLLITQHGGSFCGDSMSDLPVMRTARVERSSRTAGDDNCRDKAEKSEWGCGPVLTQALIGP